MLAFHETVCAVPLPDDDPLWKNSVFKYFKIFEDLQERQYILDNCFRHIDDLGKDKNKRIYLGPGRDGSSDDKIPVDCKFDSQSTKITFNTAGPSHGYVKSSFALEEEGCELQVMKTK